MLHQDDFDKLASKEEANLAYTVYLAEDTPYLGTKQPAMELLECLKAAGYVSAKKTLEGKIVYRKIANIV